MSEKKYSLLTDSDIEKGLQDKLFQKENIALIRDNEGKIVKHLPTACFKRSIIPPTLIQINSTYIYQADIKSIIDAIIETKNFELFEDLEEKYQIVIDSLTYYKDHNKRLDELNSKSLEVSSVFDRRVERYLKNINTSKLDDLDIEQCTTMLDSYINMLFIYIISTYWIHKDKISNDTIAKNKIEKLEKNVRYIYEQLLAESNKDDKGINKISMHNSLYAKYLLEDEKGINKIEKFIRHDSRFDSVTQFMEFILRHFLKKTYSNYGYQNSYQEPARYEITIRLDKNMFDKKNKFALSFFDILEKISILKNVYNEIMDAGEIDFDKIKTYESKEAKKTLHLTAIPLALHSDR